MLFIEHDMTVGGSPVLHVERDSLRDDELRCYLSITVKPSDYNGGKGNNIFLSLTEDDMRRLHSALGDMLDVTCH